MFKRHFPWLGLILGLSLITPSCEKPSGILVALDLITVTAGMLPATVPDLSPEAVAWIPQVPKAVICIADLVAQGADWVQAEGCVLQLESVLNSAPAQTLIPEEEHRIVQAVVAAGWNFIRLFRERVGPRRTGMARSIEAAVSKDERKGAAVVAKRARAAAMQVIPR